MSNLKCPSAECGSTNIEVDPARGETYCVTCGLVLADSAIVSDPVFEEASGGNMVLAGHYVSNESSGGASGFGSRFLGSNKESKEITLSNARRGIAHLCRQLHLGQYHIDTSVTFYKMALNQHLTRGRKQAHNHAACVYITCRTEQTPHMLIDISDILQICVHELGRTYLKFIEALNIRIPSMGKSESERITIPGADPCLYIMRFASRLDFGNKTNDVTNTAMRVVQRMKKDSIHSGRRPSGLCGAALLMAARLHEFSRSPSDIIKIVKVHESTLRKRLIEFGDTPSSALTLDEFMSVDLEEEQDPPAFKAARKKDRERLQKLENMAGEFSELQSEIDRQLEEQKSMKGKIRHSVSLEESDAERFIQESNLSVIEECVGKDPDDPDDIEASTTRGYDSHLITGLGPDIATMGLNASLHKNNSSVNGTETLSFENLTGEIDITDLDDEELDGYIMSEKEANIKSNLWNKVNEKYLQEQKEKEEKQQKEKEEGKPEKKRRRTAKKNRNQTLASTAGEAIEKMLQEKRISSKINYEVLKSLNVGIGANNQAQQKKTDDASFATPKPVEPAKEMPSTLPVINTSSAKTQPRISNDSRRTPGFKIPTSNKRKAPASDDEAAETVEEPAPVPTPVYEADAPIDEADDSPDEEPEPEDESEMSVGQLLGRQNDDGDYGYGGYGYDDEEDY